MTLSFGYCEQIAQVHSICPKGCTPYISVGIGHTEKQLFLGEQHDVFVPSITINMDHTHLRIFEQIVDALKKLPSREAGAA